MLNKAATHQEPDQRSPRKKIPMMEMMERLVSIQETRYCHFIKKYMKNLSNCDEQFIQSFVYPERGRGIDVDFFSKVFQINGLSC